MKRISQKVLDQQLWLLEKYSDACFSLYEYGTINFEDYSDLTDMLRAYTQAAKRLLEILNRAEIDINSASPN